MTDKTKAKKLVDMLRRLVPGVNQVLVTQVIALGAEFQSLDEKIADAEAEINELIFKAYGLTTDEISLVMTG